MTTTTSRIRTFAALVVLTLGLAVVPATAASASGPGSATFTITAGGAPATNTFVTLSGAESRVEYTGLTGVASFTDLALGEYTLNVSSSWAYPEFHFAFTLTDTSPSLIQDVVLPLWPVGAGVVTGTVTDRASGQPIAGAQVQGFRTDAPGGSPETTADANGVYVLTGLVTGTYWVQATAPDHFPIGAEASVTDGSTTSVDFSLLAADSVIEGRVVDPDGVGVEGIQVGATSSSDGGGYTYGTTGSDGRYSLPSAGAGTWTVITYATTEWEGSSLDLEVAAGTVGTAPDIVLVPRFTGTLAGVVASSDGIPEGQRGGFFDVCVTVLTPEGAEVPGATTVTGGDSFYSFFLAPGDYTVYFEDCDADRQPHGYQPVYLGGSPTLAGATIVTVETLVDSWLDTTTLEPQVSNPEPDHPAVPVAKKNLKHATKNLIDAPANIHRGATFEIEVGASHAGEWVSVWVYSAPLPLGGWHQVAGDGTVEVTLPVAAPLDRHRLSVQDADDHVLGWTWITVKKVKKH